MFIFAKNGSKPSKWHELDTIEKLNNAWESQRQIHACMRPVEKAQEGKLVGIDVKPEEKLVENLVRQLQVIPHLF